MDNPETRDGAKVPKKARAIRWRGLLGDADRGVRIASLVLVMVIIAALSFSQLGFMGVGTLGNYVAYAIVLLAPVAAGALLFGVFKGTLIGLYAAAVTLLHSWIQPLDYYEMFFISPLSTAAVFTLAGFCLGLVFALIVRRTAHSRAKRFLGYAVACIAVSALGSFLLQFAFSSFNFTTASPGSIVEMLRTIGSFAGSIPVQIGVDAAMMMAACVVADAIVGHYRKSLGNQAITSLFGGWLLAVVLCVFLIASAVTFVMETFGEVSDAESRMRSTLGYITEQIKINQARKDLLPIAGADQDMIDLAFDIDNILEGFNTEQDGLIVVLEKNTVAASNTDDIPVGASASEVFSFGFLSLHSIISDEGGIKQIVIKSILRDDKISGDNIGGMMETAYALGKRQGELGIAIIYPSTLVFKTRMDVMLSTTLTSIAILAAVYVLASYLLRRLVVRRIDENNAVLDDIAHGNLDKKLGEQSTREFNSLAVSANAMVDSLRGLISEAETRYDRDLATAKAIQESALPRVFPPFPDIDRFDLFATMKPAREVGGDFYDFFLIEAAGSGDDAATRIGVVIADVSGKGIPASLFMMTAKTHIQNYVSSGMSLSEAIDSANHRLCSSNDAEMFVTAFVAVIDYENGSMTYVNAGHNPPLLWRGSEGAWIKDVSGMPLGLFDGMPYESFELQLETGDLLLLYTDGVTEAMNAAGELFREQRLEEFVGENNELAPKSFVTALNATLADYEKGAEQSDDITVLALKFGVKPEGTTAIIVPAALSEFDHVIEFVHDELDRRICPVKAQKALDIAIEELFVNVCNYAYPDATPDNPGLVRIRYSFSPEPPSITLEISDSGVPFDPLAKPDAVTPENIEDVPIGGLGILMAKKSVDEMTYRREDGKNKVTLKKSW